MLVREGSQEKLDALRATAGARRRPHQARRGRPVGAAARRLRGGPRGAAGRRALLPPRRDLRHDRRRGAQHARSTSSGTQNASTSPTSSAPGTSTTPPRSPWPACTRATSPRTLRRGPEARPSLPPHQVRGREARPPARHGAVARLPALDRRRQLQDRRDGQDRRALLLLQGDPEGRATRCRDGSRWSGSRSARRTSSRSTTWPPRWTTSRTSTTSTARPSTSSTRRCRPRATS